MATRSSKKHFFPPTIILAVATLVAAFVVRSGSGASLVRSRTASVRFAAFVPRTMSAMASEDLEAASSTEMAGPAATEEDADSTLVQFVVVRRDLLKTLEWPVGSVIAQACHACLAVAWENKDDPDVVQYLAPDNIDGMHKVTKEVKGDPQLLTLADKLKAEGIVFKLWTEQPENIPTAIALKPYPASRVKPLLKKYQLFK